MADTKLGDERRIVEDVLTPAVTNKIWTRNCDLFYPAVLQDFQLEAVLPVVLYIQRWGRRRGRGQFTKTYALAGSRGVSVEEVSCKLIKIPSISSGPDNVSVAVLSDLLLCFCLQNRKRVSGRSEKVQRAFATHYFSSWVDLPYLVSGLRSVPETLVSMLTCQTSGQWLEAGGRSGPFPIGGDPKHNLLLSLFSDGVEVAGPYHKNRKSDRFDESNVPVDQLLAIRIAEQLGEPPSPAASEGTGISSRLPIALKQTYEFREDITAFLQVFSRSLPRLTLLPVLESSFSLGLTCTFLASIETLFQWEKSGKVPPLEEHRPFPLFIDCSGGTDKLLRATSEEANEHLSLRLAHLPSLLMCLRILNQRALGDRRLQEEIKSSISINEPWPKDWMDLLGSILHGNHKRSEAILDVVWEWCNELAGKFAQESPELSEHLLDDRAQPNPIWRLSEVLCLTRGNRGFATDYASCLDSCANATSPHALCVARRVKSRGKTIGKSTIVVRSFVLSDVMLDYLVHRHLLDSDYRLRKGGVSYAKFLTILRERYGFHVDRSPPGMELSTDVLMRNRQILERRLRELGLLVGVNDAESMKRLQPRFTSLIFAPVNDRPTSQPALPENT